MKPNFNFCLIILKIDDLLTEFFFQKVIFWNLTSKKKKMAKKIENQVSYHHSEFNADSKIVLLFILALIVYYFIIYF